jgi:hypothetical protein
VQFERRCRKLKVQRNILLLCLRGSHARHPCTGVARKCGHWSLSMLVLANQVLAFGSSCGLAIILRIHTARWSTSVQVAVRTPWFVRFVNCRPFVSDAAVGRRCAFVIVIRRLKHSRRTRNAERSEAKADYTGSKFKQHGNSLL